MASALRKVTAAKWSWRGDAGWVDYDAKMNLHIEGQFLDGVKRISVDGERFVDVSLTVRSRQVSIRYKMIRKGARRSRGGPKIARESGNKKEADLWVWMSEAKTNKSAVVLCRL